MNHLPISRVDNDFPFALSTPYSCHCRKKHNWLTRHGPDGHRGRNLWILVQEFNTWAESRGIQYRLPISTGTQRDRGEKDAL